MKKMLPVMVCAASIALWAQGPRAAAGHPNLNGIWQALNEANWDLEGHGARPSPVVAMGAWGLMIKAGSTAPVTFTAMPCG